MKKNKMTMEQFLAMPEGMSFQEWWQILDKQEKKEKRIRKLAEEIQECEDALDVLLDEEGSDRWIKWQEKLEKARAKLENLQK